MWIYARGMLMMLRRWRAQREAAERQRWREYLSFRMECADPAIRERAEREWVRRDLSR